ncbi:MAG: HAD-IA family hydrolase [Gammaproteobacteria bacterium]|nr:HAD-IA family hydrolase [Gammaproteobacteria bacterium]
MAQNKENCILRTVLFDLDGTLADTAPDLAYALNAVLQENGHQPLPFDIIRPVVSHGGTALIRLGFHIGPDHADFNRLRDRLLEIYRANLARHTRLFPGMEAVLDEIEQRGMRWGVVTNKPAWLTEPLLEALELSQRAACIVSGDSTAKRKPDPEPMFYACHLAGSHAAECVYIGDAERDIEAGRRAGMQTLVAMFGYVGIDDRPEQWGADHLINEPLEILAWLNNRTG